MDPIHVQKDKEKKKKWPQLNKKKKKGGDHREYIDVVQ